jgi:D-proline reductase (dithiol) PrdB
VFGERIMVEKEEGRAAGLRRLPDADDGGRATDAVPATVQLLGTLREGYSWVKSIENRHPGWHLSQVDGFPFCLPAKSLAASRVCMVSLAGVYLKGQKPFVTSPGLVPPGFRAMRFRDQGDWSVREIPVDCEPSELLIAHAHYDHTDADEDINCVFPLARLWELEVEGYIGECAPVHYSLMGYVPEVDRIVRAANQHIIPGLRAREISLVVVSGGCELSHQSAGLIQREIEAAGIPTVGVSVCRDITYQLQVPRAVALRFPLGNPFGSAMDTPMHSRVLKDALALIESAKAPGEVVDLPYDWIKA